MKKTGNLLIVVSILFASIETAYFGCNLYPTRNEEFICDIISLIILFIGLILRKKSK